MLPAETITAAGLLEWSTVGLGVATVGLAAVAGYQAYLTRDALAVARATLAAELRPLLVEAELDPSVTTQIEVGGLWGNHPFARGDVAVGCVQADDHMQGLASIDVLNVGRGPAIIRGSRVISFATLRHAREPAIFDGPHEPLVIPADRTGRLVFFMDPAPDWWGDQVTGRLKFWVEVLFSDVDDTQRWNRYFQVRPRGGTNAWHIGSILSAPTPILMPGVPDVTIEPLT